MLFHSEVLEASFCALLRYADPLNMSRLAKPFGGSNISISKHEKTPRYKYLRVFSWLELAEEFQTVDPIDKVARVDIGEMRKLIEASREGAGSVISDSQKIIDINKNIC